MRHRIAYTTRAVLYTLSTVLRKPRYIAILSVTTILALLIVVILSRLSSLTYLVTQSFSLSLKTKTIWYTLASGIAVLSWVEILIALLIGLNITVSVYYFQQYIAQKRLMGVGAFGVLFGFIGMGCAACGSIVLTSILGIGASSQLLGILPLKGVEFSIIGIVLLLVSTIIIALRIDKPGECAITNK